MLLTKKNSSAGGHVSHVHSTFVHNLKRGLSSALPTMDRRAFLRRSGLGVGVGLAATQLTLVKKSKVRQFSNVVVSSADPSKPGTGYNLHLGAFVRNQWDARGEAQHSPSLARAVMHLERLGAKHV